MPNSCVWNQRYLQMAHGVASWSKDPSTKVGAVIIGAKGQVLSTGYNGFPRGIADTSDLFTSSTSVAGPEISSHQSYPSPENDLMFVRIGQLTSDGTA